jgi:pimeloyl-ACP methyl ester carboxylesterase
MQPFIDRYRAREAEIAEQLAELRRAAEANPSAESWGAFQLLNATLRMGDPTAIDRVVGNPYRLQQEWTPIVERTLDALFESLPEFDWRPQMSAVDALALVVHGEEDGPVSAREEWVNAFPRGRLLSLPGVGHFPFIEAPDELFPVLDEHLRLRA